MSRFQTHARRLLGSPIAYGTAINQEAASRSTHPTHPGQFIKPNQTKSNRIITLERPTEKNQPKTELKLSRCH